MAGRMATLPVATRPSAMTVRNRKAAGPSPERVERLVRGVTHCTHRLAHHPFGHGQAMFFLFSNRLGCLGSLLLSAVLTLVLLLVLDVL
jgi:hypothetical protein